MHEIAVLADQRSRAGHAFTSDALEEWHGYSLPAFTERMKSRLRNQREDGHQPWPAKGRHTRYTAEINRRTRPGSAKSVKHLPERLPRSNRNHVLKLSSSYRNPMVKHEPELHRNCTLSSSGTRL